MMFWIDKFLLYPITCSFLSTCLLTPIPGYFWGFQWKLVALVVTIPALLVVVICTIFMPVLETASDRLILRTCRSCSICREPERYLHATFDSDRQSLFYKTTWQNRDSNDPSIKNKSIYYVISAFQPLVNELVTTASVEFQPEGDIGKKKEAYMLPEGYYVQANGPDKQGKKTASFTSIGANGKRNTYFGRINSKFLQPVEGVYLVSNCRSELSRWWYGIDCTLGYVHSKHILLKQGEKILLQEPDNRVQEDHKTSGLRQATNWLERFYRTISH